MGRACLLGILVTATAYGLFVCPALAGSYEVSACSPSGSSGLWAPVNTFPASFRTGNLCGGPADGPVDGANEGGLYAEDILVSPINMPDGTRAGWVFAAPPGTTIISISYYRYLAAHGVRHMIAGLLEADGTILEDCTVQLPLGSPIDCAKVNSQAPVRFGGLNTSSLFLGVACRYVLPDGGCGSGGTIHSVRAVMYSARVTLAEDSAPVIGDVGGPLWGAGAVSGSVPVTFAASDATGIKTEVVRSESGGVVASGKQLCDSALAQPCPQVPGGSLSVDTTRVADGPHTFSLVVTDGAGNTQVATSPAVVVDNYGPPAPSALSAVARGAGSSVIALAWRDPVRVPVAIVGAMVQLCQSACGAAMALGSSGAAEIMAPGPGVYSVRLWLVDASGRGGPHNAAVASVTVPAAAATGPVRGTRTRIAASLRGRRLRVSGTILRSGRVRVSWRSKRGSRTLGAGSRVVAVRDHRMAALTFVLSDRARHGTIRIAVRAAGRIVAQARARVRT